MVEDLTERVRLAVAQQPFMTTLGVTVARAVAAVLDSACGYAAWSAADGEVDVLTVEYKINLLEPAVGERVLCQGRVVRSGGRLTVCRGEAYADGKLVAASTTTMAVRAR